MIGPAGFMQAPNVGTAAQKHDDEAFHKGWLAGWNQKRKRNPYELGTSLHSEYEEGFRQGSGDD